jgi:molecular chaperone Hsp33
VTDILKRWLLAGSRVRGSVVSLDQSWQEIVARHHQDPRVLNYLGEMTAAAVLLAASIKFDGYLTLQIQGDGPVALMLVDCDPAGTFRATYRLRSANDELSSSPNPTINEALTLNQLVNQTGKGRFAVTLSPRDKHQQPYQGIVAFEGDTVSQILESYMGRSEQLPTRMWLASSSQRAVGLLLQQMPTEGGINDTQPASDLSAPETENSEAGAWEHMVQLADTLTSSELLAEDPETIVRRLYWQDDLRSIDDRACRFVCQCSRQKVVAMLQMLGKPELDSIIDERGSVQVNCEYCNTEYVFDSVDAGALFHADGTAVEASELNWEPKTQRLQ